MVMAAELRGLGTREKALKIAAFQREVRDADREGRLIEINPGMSAKNRRSGNRRHNHVLLQENQTVSDGVPARSLSCNFGSCEGAYILYDAPKQVS